MIRDSLKEFADVYLNAKKKYIRAQSSMPEIDLPLDSAVSKIKKGANISSPYGIKGSVGETNFYMPESPWIGVFDKDITPMSAQKGYYIVYLFRTDMNGFYLSLNQGFTQYKKKYGNKNGRLRIEYNARLAAQLLNGVLDFNIGKINLLAKNDLAKGYEAGNICSKYYEVNNLPDDDIITRDLNNMIGLYRELKGMIGKEILTIENYTHLLSPEVDESEYQLSIQESDNAIEFPSGPIKRPPKIPSDKSTSFKRDPKAAKAALRQAGFKCEVDSTHNTFIVRGREHQYMEAHHLIPISYQHEFEYSIDVPENIISVCPNCHRKIHHAKFTKIQSILSNFLFERKFNLQQRGIMLNEDKLFKMYV